MSQSATATLPPAAGITTTANTAAADTTQAALGAENDRYLTFNLAGDTYALPILDVVEIIEHRPITVVPMMPAFIRGVLNLRGSVVPVLDLAARFGCDATTLARRTCILIVDTSHRAATHSGDSPGIGQRMGILVDAVNKVFHVTADDIEPPPQLGNEGGVVKGMARHDDQFIVILDLNHLLAAEHLRALAAATQAGRQADGPQPLPS
ncbi:MAG TPA: chemotaxis protein CheW [Kineosporiaceae bacterium]|nr:chemotaxis protein CheW [Kineosporiaceae bacterium]